MSTRPDVLESFHAAGALDPAARPDAVVVDWERLGKDRRQAHATRLFGSDTTIGTDDEADLRRAAALGVRTICRINPLGPQTAREIERAAANGAHEVLVPMVRGPRDVERVLALTGATVGVGVMLETVEALRHAPHLGAMPITFGFLGLVDLAIERRSPSIFAPLLDGTVDRVAADLGDVAFGFGGLTRPGCGRPLPDRLLVGELDRVGASFSVLRRSFLGDLDGRDPASVLAEIRTALRSAEGRDAAQVAADRTELVRAVGRLLHDGSGADRSAPAGSTHGCDA